MKKILIADDDEEVLKLLSERLRKNNYYVTAVSKGQDAVDRCRLDKPDLVLLDIAMPDMDGYAIASALREDNLLSDIPIIFVTGKDLEHKGIQERVARLGIYDYIMKPCSFQELLKKIQGFIG
jgi:CheY-like chemotaxis protein